MLTSKLQDLLKTDLLKDFSPFSGAKNKTPELLLSEFTTECPVAMMAIDQVGARGEVMGFLTRLLVEQQVSVSSLEESITQARIQSGNALTSLQELLLAVRAMQKLVERLVDTANLPPGLLQQTAERVARSSELWAIEQHMQSPKVLWERAREVTSDVCRTLGIPESLLMSEMFYAGKSDEEQDGDTIGQEDSE